MSKILFLHGLESLPGGSKVRYLEGRGYEVLNPFLPKDSWERSVDIAQRYVDEEKPSIIVGSSRGGAVAMAVDPGAARLVLVAPAWKRFGCAPACLNRDTIVIHSPKDDIVDYENSVELSDLYGVRLISAGECHRMNDPSAHSEILKAVIAN